MNVRYFKVSEEDLKMIVFSASSATVMSRMIPTQENLDGVVAMLVEDGTLKELHDEAN